MNYDQHNFPWELTNKEVVVFVPNFARKKFIVPTLERFKTNVPTDKWIFLVVNDGIHEDLSDLEKYNLCWFNFERADTKERNGGPVRNYVIKRVQSRILASRDPEIVVDHPDFVDGLLQLKEDESLRCCRGIELTDPDTDKIFQDNTIDLSTLRPLRVWEISQERKYESWHWAYGIHTKKLIELGGYDERFAEWYGHEDTDLLCRILNYGMRTIMPSNFIAYHIFHPRMIKFTNTIRDAGLLSESLPKNRIIANQGIEWGNG